MINVPLQIYEGPLIQVPATPSGNLPDGTPLYELTERFYVRSQFLGERSYQWPYTNSGRLSQVSSLAFFCFECGDLWARRTTAPGYWHAVGRLCPKHGGGSLLLPGEVDVLDDWPIALITYEFILESKEL